MPNYTPEQVARISELDAAIDAAADQDDDNFFTAVAAKDEYIDSQGIDRDQLEVTGREVPQRVITIHSFEGTPPRDVYDRTQTDD